MNKTAVSELEWFGQVYIILNFFAVLSWGSCRHQDKTNRLQGFM